MQGKRQYFISRSRSKAKQIVFRLSMPIQSRIDMVRIGSQAGGWYVPAQLIHPSSVCYAAGVGEDITFDLGLIEEFQCEVHAFDPTPRAKQHAITHGTKSEKFFFHNYGLWSEDTTLKFYSPRDPSQVSHSVMNLQNTKSYFEAPVKSLRSIMKELGHSKIDLLKIDIEGAEYDVLESLIEDAIDPLVLCVEFDQPVPYFRPVSMVAKLRRRGYQPVKADKWNVTFVRVDGM